MNKITAFIEKAFNNAKLLPADGYFGLVVTEPAPLLFFSYVSYALVLLPNLVSLYGCPGTG